MKATAKMYYGTYQNELKPESKVTETPFANLTEEERKKLGKQLTDRFMKKAGFSPAPG